jgi:hypothetical protein
MQQQGILNIKTRGGQRFRSRAPHRRSRADSADIG